jgi:hypothetical protein
MTKRLNKAGWTLMGIFMLAGLSCGTDKASNPPPDPEAFSAEAESFTESHNVGGRDIGLVECAGASGQYVVTGIDTEGEWIEILVSVPEAGLYDVNLRYQALRDEVIVVKLTAEGCGGEQEPEFTLNQGNGVG